LIMDVLRFITAGSVDDGKSTLIGRLLYDTGNIKDDILASVSGKGTDSELNLAYITDGLRAERQQGITIDVAYKYFSTKNRKYIISDAPGHFQYIKNLVTGASGVDAMIILIDARNGITEQTRRHSLVASFLGIRHIAIAINKMDALDYDERVFNAIKNEYRQIAEKLSLHSLTFIPISALCGDNISTHSKNMPWYNGTTLLRFLEHCPAHTVNTAGALRFSVQYVKKNGYDDVMYMGKVLSGTIKTGDMVTIQPQQYHATVKEIVHGYDVVTDAHAGQNVCIYLDKDTSVERGSIICDTKEQPIIDNTFEATICWLDAYADMTAGKEYLLKINSLEAPCRIAEVLYNINNTTFDKSASEGTIAVNQFAKVRIECAQLIAFDHFAHIMQTGRGILIDPETNNTSGAFVIA
jgi:sulfate adenylyltransferase subunit 1